MLNARTRNHNIGAVIITYTILGAPYYNHSMNISPNPILIINRPPTYSNLIDPLWNRYRTLIDPFKGTVVQLLAPTLNPKP